MHLPPIAIPAGLPPTAPVPTAPILAAVGDGTALGFYLTYALVAVGLVWFLAGTLRRNGAVFLANVFDDDAVAVAVNHLLTVGFYLLNLGYAFLLFQLRPDQESLLEAFDHFVVRVAWLLLSLGVIHLLNMLVFWRIRTHRDRNERRHLGPAYLPVTGSAYGPAYRPAPRPPTPAPPPPTAVATGPRPPGALPPR